MKRILLLLTVLVTISSQAVIAQTHKLSGRVLDENGQPLPGATVVVKGSNIGTVADDNGNFVINNVPNAGAKIKINYAGYSYAEADASSANVSIRLNPLAKELSGVAVTALAIRREKKELGYSSTSIGSDELNSGNQVNALSALQGKVAGANITSSTGGPGGSTRIVLRGEKTIAGGNNALIVVDGIVTNNGSRAIGSSLSQIDFGNRGTDINPDDIENITVLKGAAAAALYGSAGANGAIMITTKSGKARKKDKMEVMYSTDYTLSSVLKYPEFQHQYGQGDIYGIYDDRRENFSWGLPFDGVNRAWGQVINGKQMVKPYQDLADNVKSFYNTGTTWQNNVSLSKNLDKSSFFLSLNTLNNKGVTPNTFYDKYSIRFNGNIELSPKVYAVANINYINISSRAEQMGQGNGGVWNQLLQTPRDIPIWELKQLDNPFYAMDYTDAQGTKRYGYYGAYTRNPYWVAENFDNRSKTDRVLGAVTIGWKPNSNWNIFNRAGADITSDRFYQKTPKYFFQPFDAFYGAGTASSQNQSLAGGYFEQTVNTTTFYDDLIASYSKKLSEDVSFDGMLGANASATTSNSLAANIDPTTNGLVIPGYYNFGNAVSPVTVSNSLSQIRSVALYGSAKLGYKNQLFLEVTARNDKNSTLNPYTNTFFYPSASGSWIFSETFKEKMVNSRLSYGKVRASWASVGNGAPGAYLTNPAAFATTTSSTSFGSVKFPFNTVPAFSLGNTIANQLRPARSLSSEVGVELGFFKDRIFFEATYYKSYTYDQIISVPTAPSSGFTSRTINLGDVVNKGLEMALRFTPVHTKSGFKWDVNATYTRNRNEVLSLADGVSRVVIGGFSGMEIAAAVGKPFGAFYAIDNQTDANGYTIVDPATGLPKPTTNAVYKGSYQPRFMASLGTNLSYKGFSLNVLFDTKQGGVFYSRTKDIMEFVGTSANTGNRDDQVFPNSVYLDANGNSVANTTKYTPYDYYTSVAPNGTHVLDASYIKLREASLGYTLPSKLVKKTGFSSAKVSLFGNNLFIWTSKVNKYADPEVGTGGNSDEQGLDFSARPSLRNYGISLKVTF
jgi:TonB-linked SusC/RagA family outer membrane protein